MIKVPHNRAIELFEGRLRELNSSSVDLQALRSRIMMDVEEVFGRGSTQMMSVITLRWPDKGGYNYANVFGKYRQTLQGFIDFIRDFHIIAQEKIEISEEQYKKEYHDLLEKWNSLVPEYDGLVTETEQLRKSLDDALAENRTMQQKLRAEMTEPEVRRILFLGASPLDEVRLRLDKEIREIEDALRITALRDSFDLKQKWAVTAEVLQRSMLEEDPKIVHFSGHGDTAGIAVEDTLGNARMIGSEVVGRLFEAFSGKIECVLMNSCYSESQAREISRHVPYVIGMKKSVSDDLAIAFSVGFYTALGAGWDIKFAFKMGVLRIELEGIDGSDVPLLLG